MCVSAHGFGGCKFKGDQSQIFTQPHKDRRDTTSSARGPVVNNNTAQKTLQMSSYTQEEGMKATMMPIPLMMEVKAGPGYTVAFLQSTVALPPR